MALKVTKLNQTKLVLLITGLVELVFALISCIGFFFNQPGWLIGVLLGGISALITVYFSQISATIVLKKSKPALFLLFNFVKVIVFLVFFTMLVIFQYVLHFEVFINSFWGYIIAFAPSTLITVLSELLYKQEEKNE